ncbi:helix-turn-helix transcriptional regulator [bacterium]|nr:helix-turn-helix transcriptional regulator [bacterium]
MLEIGKKIKELRIQKSLTQEQLAKRLWVTKALISAYETGSRFPSLEVLVQLAYTFNVSIDYLLGVNKKQVIDVSNLSPSQIEIVNRLIVEFSAK